MPILAEPLAKRREHLPLVLVAELARVAPEQEPVGLFR
jgi:hypothetical protein